MSATFCAKCKRLVCAQHLHKMAEYYDVVLVIYELFYQNMYMKRCCKFLIGIEPICGLCWQGSFCMIPHPWLHCWTPLFLPSGRELFGLRLKVSAGDIHSLIGDWRSMFSENLLPKATSFILTSSSWQKLSWFVLVKINEICIIVVRCPWLPVRKSRWLENLLTTVVCDSGLYLQGHQCTIIISACRLYSINCLTLGFVNIVWWQLGGR